MLLVLFIVLSISFICSIITVKMSEKVIVDQFFHQLILDIQMAQTLAMENKKYVIVSLSSMNNYQVYYSLDNVLIVREFPDLIEFNAEASDLHTLRINQNGHNDKFGKIIFNTPFGQKTLMVYISKGRVRYVE